ncbi:MAG: hypothetical protein ACOCZK_03955 [Planctomycetota bacterium]
MTTLRFPLRFLDAVRIGDDDTVYYVVGLEPEWRLRTFKVWLMTAPDGIETWAPLYDVQIVEGIAYDERRAFLEAMDLTTRQKLLMTDDSPPTIAKRTAKEQT